MLSKFFRMQNFYIHKAIVDFIQLTESIYILMDINDLLFNQFSIT